MPYPDRLVVGMAARVFDFTMIAINAAIMKPMNTTSSAVTIILIILRIIGLHKTEWLES
jgi:hypothetical protein